MVKKRLPIMTVILVLCGGIGVGLALTMPPKYEASAALLVEGAELPATLFTSTVQTQAARGLKEIELRLMTRANLLDIAKKYNVFANEPSMSPDEIVSAMRRLTRFQISSGRDQATILRISFESQDPKAAADVVNEFVTYVLRADVERRTDASGETLEFFAQRVERLSEKLAKQSAEIVAFKEANNDALPDGLNFRLDRQSQLQERVNLAARDRTSLIEQRNRLLLVGQSSGASQFQMTPQMQEINRLETELRSKLAIYAPDSPTIKFLKKRIEILQSNEPLDIVQEEEEGGMSAVLKLQLAEIDSRIASLDEEVRTLNLALEDLSDAIERTPKVAITLDGMQREYETTQTQYNEAVRARSTAEQGVDVETAAKGERVALIEQAAVPGAPTSPNRKLIAGGGVFVGSALAAAFFVLTELVNSSIRRPIDLARGLGIQPLATIPFLEEQSVRRRRHFLKATFILLVIVSIPLALWALHTYYLPLDLLFEKVLERTGL
ncbi:MAG: lipopolysaccharide biosynthesis [Silicimonas sp.]|nr:lipopolysaccharide biosynthesis [Silicimonas sp.]